MTSNFRKIALINLTFKPRKILPALFRAPVWTRTTRANVQSTPENAGTHLYRVSLNLKSQRGRIGLRDALHMLLQDGKEPLLEADSCTRGFTRSSTLLCSCLLMMMVMLSSYIVVSWWLCVYVGTGFHITVHCYRITLRRNHVRISWENTLIWILVWFSFIHKLLIKQNVRYSHVIIVHIIRCLINIFFFSQKLIRLKAYTNGNL